MKRCSIILTLSLTACATAPSTEYGPPKGTIYEDDTVTLSILRSKSHDYLAAPTCEVLVRLANKGTAVVEPKFKIVFLGSQGNTITQKEVPFPVVLPNKEFSGAIYLHSYSCKPIAQALGRREK